MRRFSLTALSAALVLPVGCGQSTPFSLAPVSGRVTFNGRPLANAYVNFQPLGEDPGPGSMGMTDQDGRYTLSVISHQVKGEGAVVGHHRVSIGSGDKTDVPYDEETGTKDGSVPTGAIERIPARYNQDSQLRFEVPPDGTTEANFELRSR